MMLLFIACAQPVHLQYDFGRASWEAQRIQADLARESVKDALYPLSGHEAAEIRNNNEKATTNEETGEAEAIAK